MSDYAAEKCNIIVNGRALSGLVGTVKPPGYKNDLISHKVGSGGTAVRVAASDRSAEFTFSMLMHAPDYRALDELAERQSMGLTDDVPILVEVPGAGVTYSGRGSIKKPPSPELAGFGEASEDAPMGEFVISMPGFKKNHTGIPSL